MEIGKARWIRINFFACDVVHSLAADDRQPLLFGSFVFSLIDANEAADFGDVRESEAQHLAFFV